MLGPYFSAPDQFATKTTFEITRKDSGERVTLEEITVYTVNQDDLITREQFFFGGDKW